MRNSKGQFLKGTRNNIKNEFKKGEIGFWKNKKRPNISGSNNFKWIPFITKKCEWCGIVFETKKTKNKRGIKRFCTQKCAAKWRFNGENNPKWSGGKAREWDKLKMSDGYKVWRLDIFKRDKFTCRFCGYRSKKSKAHGDKTSDIQAHHIIPLREKKELAMEITNGITLCLKCHRLTYGKEKNFTMVFKEILRDFMSNIPKG